MYTSQLICVASTYMPETKGKFLDEIKEAFLQETSTKGNPKVSGRNLCVVRSLKRIGPEPRIDRVLTRERV